MLIPLRAELSWVGLLGSHFGRMDCDGGDLGQNAEGIRSDQPSVVGEMMPPAERGNSVLP